MARRKLYNYVLTHRKRTELSQQEVAYLFGLKSGAKISRCERFEREQGVKAAIAYEVVFGIPVKDLFAGLFEEVEEEIINRVALLATKLMSAKLTPRNQKKLDSLAAIVRRSNKTHEKGK